jgi:hypothetical protein
MCYLEICFYIAVTKRNYKSIIKSILWAVNMAEYRGHKFVGIEEDIKDIPSYYYCTLQIYTGEIIRRKTVASLGSLIASEFGRDFRQKIRYEPPTGIDMRRAASGSRPSRYHQFSVMEQDLFEKSVLDALQGQR